MIDIKAIREAAEAATLGGWITSDNSHIYSAGLQLLAVAQHCRDKEANAKHIATANPATVLALCDEVEKLRKDAARYQWLKRERVNENYEGDLRIEFECGFDHYNDIDKSIDAAMEAKQ